MFGGGELRTLAGEMLNFPLIHPDILRVLGRAGHGSQILIADGNYPFRTTLGANAELVSLNLSPGIVSATDVLAALVAAVPIESAAVMAYATEGPYAMAEDPPIWGEFRDILAAGGFTEPMEKMERFAFYDAGRGRDVALAVATAEQRIFGNVLLTMGVIKPD